jgi:hypothetical protein
LGCWWKLDNSCIRHSIISIYRKNHRKSRRRLYIWLIGSFAR